MGLLRNKRLSLRKIITASALPAAGILISIIAVFFIVPVRERLQNRRVTHMMASSIHMPFNYVTKSLWGLASTESVLATLALEAPPDNRDILVALDTVRQSTDASIVYLLDSVGQVVACTPYGEERKKSLTGNNYSFRPYFTKVMESGQSSAYGALGVTTGERGMYLSVPVLGEDRDSLGVVVAKLPMTTIDEVLFNNDGICMLVSADGVIFASNLQDWLFQTCFPLTEEERSRIIESRQFGDREISSIGMDLSGPVISLEGRDHFVEKLSVLFEDWQLIRIVRRNRFDILLLLQLMPIVIAGVYVIAYSILYFISRSRFRGELQEREERYRQLFDESPVAYFVIENGIFTNCNRAAELMLRGDRSRIVGQPPDLLSPEFQPDGSRSSEAAKEKIAEAIKKGKNVFEWKHRRLNGEEFWVNVSLSACTRKGCSTLQVVWLDISDRKTMDEELKGTLAETERVNRLMTGREDRILELKAEVNDLMILQGHPPKYRSAL